MVVQPDRHAAPVLPDVPLEERARAAERASQHDRPARPVSAGLRGQAGDGVQRELLAVDEHGKAVDAEEGRVVRGRVFCTPAGTPIAHAAGKCLLRWTRRIAEGGVIAEKEEKIEMEGEIIESLRNRMFKIRLDNGHEMLGYTAGRMKRYRIRMLLGDRVRIELSPYDLDRGRIVYRLK